MIEFGIWLTSAAISSGITLIAGTFFREKCYRGAIISLAFFLPLAALWIAGIIMLPDARWVMVLAPWGVVLLAALALFLPYGARTVAHAIPTQRVDERDIMFARARYREGDPNYERYYAEHPELKVADDFTRHLPALGEPGGATWDPLNAPIAGACFSWIERIRESADGERNAARTDMDPQEASRRLIGMAKFLGALAAGTTAVAAGHVYSHVGRGAGEWGAELQPADYPHALVFTVEMKEEYLGAAPLQPELADSGRQYAQAAVIALVIAEYLRSLGHDARAHIDGNYRLILPPLAADAGLGEVGRHSLLISPQAGSRVRIGAVTTSLPLAQSRRINTGVEDFCGVCKKCASNCPSHAIPTGEMENVRGARYWKIHPVRCFRYWRGVGTDCGVCISVCPYSHPRGLMHDIVRAACSRNGLSRRLFSALDDLFYGREPRHWELPDWMHAGLPDGPVRRTGRSV